MTPDASHQFWLVDIPESSPWRVAPRLPYGRPKRCRRDVAIKVITKDPLLVAYDAVALAEEKRQGDRMIRAVQFFGMRRSLRALRMSQTQDTRGDSRGMKRRQS